MNEPREETDRTRDFDDWLDLNQRQSQFSGTDEWDAYYESEFCDADRLE